MTEDCACNATAPAKDAPSEGALRADVTPLIRMRRVERLLVGIRMTRAGNDRQDEAGWVVRVVVDTDVTNAHFGGCGFGFAGLQVTREMRKECAGDLHTDAMACLEDVRSQQAVEIQANDFAGL